VTLPIDDLRDEFERRLHSAKRLVDIRRSAIDEQ